MIQRVARLEDARLAEYARVADPAYLRDRGLFVAEGRLVVRRLFETHRYDVHSVLVTPAALAALSDVLVGAPVYVAEQALLNAITGFNFHRGCLALARRPQPSSLEDLAGAQRLVALEGVGNPDNVGGIFRVAAAFAVDGVLLGPATGDPLFRKAIRTSMGAVLQVPHALADEWPHALGRLKALGFQVIALTPRDQAIDVRGFEPRRPWVVLAGAEGPGLSDAGLAIADVHARIPIASSVDSLNVTVATGIALSSLCSSESA